MMKGKLQGGFNGGRKKQGGWVQLAADAVGAVGSFLTGKKQAKEAKKAAKYQYYAAQEEREAQEQIRKENKSEFNRFRKEVDPYRQSGTTALQKMQELLYGPPKSPYGKFEGLAALGYTGGQPGQTGAPMMYQDRGRSMTKGYRNRGRVGEPFPPMAQSALGGSAFANRGILSNFGGTGPYMAQLQKRR